MKYLAVFNASAVFDGADGTDINPWLQAGVPGGSLENQNDRYFFFHHSNGEWAQLLPVVCFHSWWHELCIPFLNVDLGIIFCLSTATVFCLFFVSCHVRCISQVIR